MTFSIHEWYKFQLMPPTETPLPMPDETLVIRPRSLSLKEICRPDAHPETRKTEHKISMSLRSNELLQWVAIDFCRIVSTLERQRTPYACSSTTLASSIDNTGIGDHTQAPDEVVDEDVDEGLPTYETVLEQIVQKAQQAPSQTAPSRPSQERDHSPSVLPPVSSPPPNAPTSSEPDYYASHSNFVSQDPDAAPPLESILSISRREPSRRWGQGRTVRPNFQSMSAMIPPALRLYIDIAFTPLGNDVGIPDEVRLAAREILKELVDMKTHEMRELRREVRSRVSEERESRKTKDVRR